MFMPSGHMSMAGYGLGVVMQYSLMELLEVYISDEK